MFCLFSEVSKYEYSTTYKYEIEDEFENSQKLTFRRLSKKCSLSLPPFNCPAVAVLANFSLYL